MGRLLIFIGIILVIAGTIITYSNRIPFLGKLPGDITVEKENFKLYVPITTSILLSILLSFIFYIINRFRN